MPGVLSFGEIPLRYHLVTLVNKCRFALRPLSWTACLMIPAQAAGASNICSSNPRFSLIQKSKSDYVKFALQVSRGVRFVSPHSDFVRRSIWWTRREMTCDRRGTKGIIKS